MVEDDGIEPTTPCLQSRCSPSWANPPMNHLDVWWVWLESNQRPLRYQHSALTNWATDPSRSRLTQQSELNRRQPSKQPISVDVQFRLQFSRKEVIQPHLPIRLPCYDFTPVTNPAVVIAPLAVRLTTSGRTRSHGVTGGVYKTRERIHRDILIHDY